MPASLQHRKRVLALAGEDVGPCPIVWTQTSSGRWQGKRGNERFALEMRKPDGWWRIYRCDDAGIYRQIGVVPMLHDAKEFAAKWEAE